MSVSTLNTLDALSPIDGRYHSQTSLLSPYFSEKAWIRTRVLIEIEYFQSLLQFLNVAETEQDLKKLKEDFENLKQIWENMDLDDAFQEIKDIEKKTNHDMKAVEYYVKSIAKMDGLKKWCEFVHFGLTSQDINNTVIPFLIKKCLNEIMIPRLKCSVIDPLKSLGQKWMHVPMLARTHGQPATPTRVGKELMVFVERLELQLQHLTSIPITAKFGGATGNFNSHFVAYPTKNWPSFANRFLSEKLGLIRQQYTTQIEHYDELANLFHAFSRINTILIDLCRDIWSYISLDYFKQKVISSEVGSSAMPHKVNPIDFENAEGNLGIANVLFVHFSTKLPVSRLQRDLTDSTVCRNFGVPFAHTLISLNSIQKGLGKLILNETAINKDLDNNWNVISEAIQTILRREQYEAPYELLKNLTRSENGPLTQKDFHNFIDQLDVTPSVKCELKEITPFNYIGVLPTF